MKKINVEAFETTDGKVFLSEQKAKKHQKDIDAPVIYPYIVRVRQELEISYDSEVEPTDPKLKTIVKDHIKMLLKNHDNVVLLESMYDINNTLVIGDAEFISVEYGG